MREDFRMADLVKKFNEQTERKSLRQRIEEMEDEVLANAGVDVFEEVFKLIFTKLYDDANSDSYCPRTEDYNIFFATQRKAVKDNSGEKIYATRSGFLLRDAHGHEIVEHDFFNHENLTEDGIFEAFREFAKKEKLSFATDFFA